MRVWSRRQLDFLIRSNLHTGQIQGSPVGVQDTNLSIAHRNEVLGVSDKTNLEYQDHPKSEDI